MKTKSKSASFDNVSVMASFSKDDILALPPPATFLTISKEDFWKNETSGAVLSRARIWIVVLGLPEFRILLLKCSIFQKFPRPPPPGPFQLTRPFQPTGPLTKLWIWACTSNKQFYCTNLVLVKKMFQCGVCVCVCFVCVFCMCVLCVCVLWVCVCVCMCAWCVCV